MVDRELEGWATACHWYKEFDDACPCDIGMGSSYRMIAEKVYGEDSEYVDDILDKWRELFDEDF